MGEFHWGVRPIGCAGPSAYDSRVAHTGEAVLVTFCVIEGDKSLLTRMIALTCESEGHHCLVLKDIAHVSRILHTIRVDALVLDVERPGLNALDWLETMAPSWPDLPSRTLILAESELKPRDVARIQELGVEVVSSPFSPLDVELVVIDRLQRPQA